MNVQKQYRLILGALASVALVTLSVAAPAAAEDLEPGVDGPQIAVEYLPLEELTVKPAIGSTLVVQESESVTVYMGVSAACTESIEVNRPRKDAGQAKAAVRFQRTDGCSGTKKRTALLWAQGFGGFWVEKDRASGSVAGGINVIVTVSFPCQNSNSTIWKSGGFFGDVASGLNESLDTTLACGA